MAKKPQGYPRQSLVTGESEAELKGHLGRVISVVFSPDGSHVISGSYDNTVHIWNVAMGESEAELKGHLSWVNSVVLSPDGSRICLDHMTRPCASGMWLQASVRQS